MQFHDIDKQVLQRLTGSPELSEAVQDAYFRVQRARHRASIPGNMDLATLTAIALHAGALELPQAVATKFGHLKEGDTVYFRINDYEWNKAMFVRVVDPETHVYEIVLDGQRRPVGEGSLRLTHPSTDAASTIPPKAPSKPASELVDPPPEDRIERPEVDPEDIVLKISDDDKQKMYDNLRLQYPKNTPVDVCPDGGEAVEGVVSHCGNGPLLGKVAVVVKGEKKFKWFRSCDVFVNEEALTTTGA